jgi:hypothetical protein
MKIKTEYLILLFIIIVLSIYLVQRDSDRSLYKLPGINEIDEKKFTKIEITGSQKAMVLNRSDDIWLIGPEKYTADADKMDGILGVIGKLKLTALVAESKGYDRYHLDKDNKITVKAFVGDQVKREFDLGKAASSYRHTFVKMSGNDRVYHGRGSFRSKFDTTVEKLRDKTVLKFDKEKISEIQISKGKESLTIIRKDIPLKDKAPNKDSDKDKDKEAVDKVETVWETADGKACDKIKINDLLSASYKLLCEKFIYNKKKSDYKEPVFSIIFKGDKEYQLDIFDNAEKDAKEFAGITSLKKSPFMLPKWKIERINKDIKEYIKN